MLFEPLSVSDIHINEQRRVLSSLTGFSNPTAHASSSINSNPSFSIWEVNSWIELNPNSIELDSSRQIDRPLTTSSSSSSSLSKPKGQFFGKQSCFSSLKMDADSDSADWARWEEMECCVSWKKPCCFAAKRRLEWRIDFASEREMRRGDTVVGGGDWRRPEKELEYDIYFLSF